MREKLLKVIDNLSEKDFKTLEDYGTIDDFLSEIFNVVCPKDKININCEEMTCCTDCWNSVINE